MGVLVGKMPDYVTRYDGRE